ncbi:MAG: DUF58 domain-containing protein [Verrucomicrobiota bacterium]
MNPALEQAFRRLQIRCRRPVEHLLAGEYRSIFKGRGIEFEELREYQAGDDVREIDWRSMARTGRPHIRRFIEEREQSFLIAVDLSASSSFGSGEKTKREAVQEIAALLAWSAAFNKDRIGLLLFTDRVERYLPPGRGRNPAQRLINELLEFQPLGTGTNLSLAIDFISHVSRKRGIVFLISDFLSKGYEQSLRMLSRRHDLTAVLVRDPAEIRLPTGGLIEMRDAESQDHRLIDTTTQGSVQTDPYDRFFKVCYESDISHFEVNPQADCVESLSSYFQGRHRKVMNETGG